MEIPRDLWGEQYSLKFGDKRSSVAFFAEQGNVRIEGSGKTIYDANVTERRQTIVGIDTRSSC